MKVETYGANWGAGDIRHKEVASLALSDLPARAVDLVWASFPCRTYRSPEAIRGLAGSETRSQPDPAHLAIWKLMRGLAQDGRAPRAIVLENVYGCLTSAKERISRPSLLRWPSWTIG
jgi:DNA (cytosine-5)-methyltransferase 1